MSSSDPNANLYRQIIMDHYTNPRRKGLNTADPDYYTVRLKNPSCGDDVTVQVKLEDDTVRDVRHDGSGCSICCSSASMMSELLYGKSLSDAEYLISQFKLMISAEPCDEDALGEAVSLHGVSHVLPRVKCASLAWTAAQDAIEREQQLPAADKENETDD